MLDVIPCDLDMDDIGDRSLPDAGEAGWVLTTRFDPGCAQCEFGCCVQVYRLPLGASEGLAVHGALGMA
jgi:hypothetical protein